MKLLLDTHLLIWLAEGSDRLSSATLNLVGDPGNTLWFSAASIWEVSIKAGLGRDDFRVDPHLLRRGLLDNGYVEIPVTSEHAAAVGQLPSIHKDPFDRVLVAQAMIGGAVLLTSDAVVASYPGPVRAV